MNTFFRFVAVSLTAATCLSADVTYNELTKFTGGSLRDAVQRMASNPILGHLGGASLKNAFQDQNSVVYIKGAKMARLGGSVSMITDLDAGTITTLNNDKHTYMVQTFEEMRQQMQQMQQRMKKGQGGDLEFDVKVDETGRTRDINGQSAKEAVITMTAKSGDANGQMVVKVDSWMVPLEGATREVADYSKKMAEKLSYAFGGLSPALGAAGGGLSAAMKETMKLNGFPVLTDTDVSGVSSPLQGMMGRGNGDASGPAIQTETQYSSFVQGPVEDSKFRVPSDYKEEKRRR